MNGREKKPIGEHSPDKYFQNWTKTNLPHSKSFWVTDCDAILRDRRGNMAIVEIKRFAACMPTSQSITYQVLDHALKSIHNTLAPVSINGYPYQIPIRYQGFFLLQFERTSFTDGRVYLNQKLSSEQEVIKVLSFLK